MSDNIWMKISRLLTGLVFLFLLNSCYYNLYEKPVFLLGPAKQQIAYPHGDISQVLFSGDFLLLTNRSKTGFDVQVFDISDPENPVFEGGIPSLGGVNERAAADTTKRYAYIPTNRSVMVVRLPVKSGEKLELVENLTADDVLFRQVKVSGWNLYVSSSAGIIVYDISKPHRPIIRQIIPNTENVRIICPVNDTLFWVAPEKPFQLHSTGSGMHRYTEEITGLYEVNGQLYLLLKNGQLINQQGNAIAEKVENLFVQDNSFYYEVTEKTGPNSPPRKYFCRWKGGAITQYDMGQLAFLKTPPGAAVREHDALYGTVLDNTLFLNRLELMPRQISRVSQNTQIPVFLHDGPVCMKKDHVLWSSAQGNGYEIGSSLYTRKQGDALSDFKFNYSLKDEEKTAEKMPDGFSGAMLIVRDYLFAPSRLFYAEKPDELKLLSGTGPAAISIKQEGNLVFLAQGDTGRIYRLPTREEEKNGKMPKLTGVIPVSDADHPVYDIEPAGNLLYACGKRALTVFNMANPMQLLKISELSLPDNAAVMIRFGNYLYIPSADLEKHTLRIINISNPGKPFIEKEIPDFSKETILQMVRYGNTFLFGDGSAIRQIDVSIPLEPKEIRRFEGPSLSYEPYRYIAVDNGDLAGKKVHHIDIWRKFELMKKGN